jgi:sortase B
MKKVLYIATILLLVAAFGFSAFQVGSYFLESKKQADRFDELSAMLEDTTPPETQAAAQSTEGTGAAEETTAPTEHVDTYADRMKRIYDLNDDLVGWIKIDGTELDYPVMQTDVSNRDFYLEHDFDGENSKRGCIYAREECDVSAPSDNITLYGHNMADGSMFAALNAYTEKEAWENNSLIEFGNLTERHTYKIFAVFKTSASLGKGFTYHQFADAKDEAEFNAFVSKCKELSFYETGETPKFGDKMITLSTCEYTLENGRLVVVAYRIF